MNGSNGAQQIVQRLWNHRNVPRDDGLSYEDYVSGEPFAAPNDEARAILSITSSGL